MKNDKKKKRKAKNRQTKTILVFDEKERKSFLTGFHKRKEARRKKAKALTEQLIKDERKQLKQMKKEFLDRKVKHQHVPQDLEELRENLTKKEVKELPQHTVTITDISDIDLAGQGGLRLGRNQFQSVEDEKSDSEAEAADADVSDKKKQNILRKIEEKIQKRSRHLKSDHTKQRKTKKTLSKKKRHKKKLADW